MGFRTLVLLQNDRAHEWENDLNLGKKIADGMNRIPVTGGISGRPADLGYGRVIECTHADTQTLAIIDGYTFSPIAHSWWRQNDTSGNTQLRLLESWAGELGYRLVKKRTKP